MAKKKTKKGRKPAPEPKEPSMFWRGALAVTLIVVAIVLIFGAFTSAPLPKSIWNGDWSALGAAAVLTPIILMYFGVLKFGNEDHKVPRGKFFGAIGSVILAAALFDALFMTTDPSTGATSGGHGGALGSGLGNFLVSLMGKPLAVIILLLLLAALTMLTLGIAPNDLLDKLKRQKPEGEEDLGALKSRMPGFKLNEGVPVEHHDESPEPQPVPRLASLRNTAQKMTTQEDHAALTTTSDADWQFPPLDLLSQKQEKADAGNVQANAETIKETFNNFNIEVDVDGANVGPRVTQFTLKPPTGVKLTKLTALENNLALDLAAHSIRMEAPIPGKRQVGIEVPNVKPANVTVHSLLTSREWRDIKSPLGFAIGKDISGVPVAGNLETMPHLLIAGQTGSGKSVMINTLLTSLLYRNSPSDMKLILVDPKQVEMALYSDIPHLLAPVINEPEKCISALKWAVAEMERRLKAFAEVKKRNIAEYNTLKKDEGMPYIVIVIDELADLMMMAARDVEALVVRLAQKARAAGIHLVLATQRPSVDVITGLIKANVPARIAFTVVSQVDSRTIIDQIGAEKLLGRGDALYNIPEFIKPKRVQGAFISDGETTKVCDFLRMQRPPQYDDEVISQPVQLNGRGGVVAPTDGGDEPMDDMWREAVAVVIQNRKASTSLLQRKLRLGYGRASRIIDLMEEQGIISHADGSKPREVLVRSIDDVFAAEPAEVAVASQGDVYDDMPDEPEDTVNI